MKMTMRSGAYTVHGIGFFICLKLCLGYFYSILCILLHSFLHSITLQHFVFTRGILLPARANKRHPIPDLHQGQQFV